MLNLLSVAGQLASMRAALATLSDEIGPRLDAALHAWDAAAAMGPELRDRVARAKTSWLVADPLEPLGAYDVGPAPAYRVLAADGSQVFPDRHELAHCYLVNVGIVDIDYRAPSARLSSEPVVAYLPEEMYPLVGGMRQEADARVVGARRFEAECDALAVRVADPDEGPLLVLVDGTLLLWWLDPDPERLQGLDEADVKARTFAAFERLLGRASANGALPAGYLSSPRTTDVASMLKVVLCTEEPVDCDRCPYASGAKSWTPRRGGPHRLLPAPARPCEEADVVVDASLFAALLTPGQRSSRFRSAARVTEAYEAPIDFVYVHTGSEIARLEFPAWVTPEGLDVLVSCVLNQCEKGMGYPVSLAEAHEQAVVRVQERSAFIELVRRGEPLRGTSTKLARKRVSVL